jgi:EpsI family protein
MIRYLAVAAMLVATALYGALHPPVNLAVGRGVLVACPVTFGPWSGAELSFDDAVVEELKADDILIRRYARGDDVVWLCIVYHQNRRYGAHDPHLCYESQGYIVERETRARIPTGPNGGIEVNQFVADRSHDRRLVSYWWTTEGLTTADADAFRRRLALAGALDNRSWGAFVRVEALVRRHDDAAARRVLDDFAARVAVELPGVLARAAATGRKPS